jgi:predicted nucleotidyltransferase
VGARRVVLFGSLASGAEPHAGTDIDLCVEGVSERDALTRVLRTIDGDVPAGDESHQELLRAASVPVEGLRAAIISTAV